MDKKNVWSSYSKKQLTELEKLNKEYRHFLDHGKTERECIREAVKLAKEAGYRDLGEVIRKKETLSEGDKVYAVCMGKTIALFHIGSKDIEKGMNILGAHVDSPRLDLKQNPLYEDTELAYLDTHYYGGIKKYQWVTIPLALHGIVAKKDGSVVDVCIGEKEDDPVFCITDLLIHLSGEQMEKKAELEVVPAGKARECGLDRSMVLAYGHDDRVCAYTSLAAMLDMKKVKRTACCILVDKEEIGSVGATGMQSRFFENTVAELLNCMGDYSDIKLRRVLANSRMLSSDVSAAFDPEFASAFEKKNTAYFAHGIVFNKYTGSRGKSGSNDANAEYMAQLRATLEKHEVAFQTAELGKVDFGGGGTIAYILALYGMQVIDCGVAVLNMHAPWEIVSKADVYEAKRCYAAFLAE